MAVGAACSFMIHTFCILSYYGAAYFANYVEYALIVVHGVLEIDGGVVVALSIGKIAFLELYDLAHQRMVEMMAKIRIVGIEVSHIYLEFFL